MKKKLPIFILLVCILLGCVTMLPLAAEGDDAELILIFEENFEEYEADVNVSSTLMPGFFVNDANAIGDGYIKVQEEATGNLYLKSHVFSQVYTATPVVGNYEFSLDIHSAQGQVQTGVFVRAPMTKAAFYEADGHPDTSVGQAGLFIYTRGDHLGVNVKTYDASAAGTAHLQNNTVKFALPDGASYPYTLGVTDVDGEISIYVNQTLICRVTYSEPGQVYSNHESEGKFFGKAKLFDAEGNEKGSYEKPLLSSDASYFGWTTRAADMFVDNVTVKVEAAYQTVLAINRLPAKVTEKNLEEAKEIVDEVRALYDTLSEEKKALVINFAKLTKVEESIEALENVTEAPTEAPTEEPTEEPTEVPTEAPTEEPTEVPTEAPTEMPTEPVETPTEAPSETADESATLSEAATDSAASSEQASDEALTETSASDADGEKNEKVVDDSLTVWILVAVMLVAIGVTAGYVTVKVRK